MSLLFEDFSIYLSSRAVDEDEDYEGDETITEVIRSNFLAILMQNLEFYNWINSFVMQVDSGFYVASK